ncbi:hypothetical protein GF407_20340 [candidate division KSB1 bacterium]|nr:hypothetical protein [candidate division KSB1 bacterium]
MTGPIFKIAILFITISNLQLAAQSYHDHAELGKRMKQLASKHPDLVELQSIGESAAGRELWVAKINSGDHPKPAILLVGNVDGRTVVGSKICLAFIEHLVKDDAKTTPASLLKQVSCYVIPSINPDAAESFFQTPLVESAFNACPVDEDNDGRVDEDGVDDLNGDGMITRMCVRDPAGDWIFDSSDSASLRPAKKTKGEKGEYLLYSEGLDNDKDGNINEDGTGGVNINRNFAFRYAPFSTGAGPYPMSAAESKALAAFCFQHPEIALVFSFSPNHNIFKPWPHAEKAPSSSKKRERRRQKPIEKVPEPDHTALAAMGEILGKMLPMTGIPASKSGNGALSEWAYFHYGRWSLSTPAWFVPSVTDSSNEKIERKQKPPLTEYQRISAWLKQNGQPQAVLNWQEIEHPDFPGRQVMIGGIKPFAGINPPADSLPSLFKRYIPVLSRLPDFISKLHIYNDGVKALYAGVYRVSVRVVNNGFLPTHTVLGSRMKWTRKIKLALALSSGQSVIEGRPFYLIDRIDAYGSSRELSWIIKSAKGKRVTLTASNPMVFSTSLVLELK